MLGITGSTGHLGGRIARLLAAEGVPQRLVVRTPAKAPRLPGATVVQASYADGAAVRRALEGVDTVLMVSAALTYVHLRGRHHWSRTRSRRLTLDLVLRGVLSF